MADNKIIPDVLTDWAAKGGFLGLLAVLISLGAVRMGRSAKPEEPDDSPVGEFRRDAAIRKFFKFDFPEFKKSVLNVNDKMYEALNEYRDRMEARFSEQDDAFREYRIENDNAIREMKRDILAAVRSRSAN